jgi:hypothetical protein
MSKGRYKFILDSSEPECVADGPSTPSTHDGYGS